METAEIPLWYALRCAKRPNAKKTVLRMLERHDYDFFTPVRRSSHTAKNELMLPEWLFVKATRSELDKMMTLYDTLDYRYTDREYEQPMTVADDDISLMRRLNGSDWKVRYCDIALALELLTGPKVRLTAEPLQGREGRLLPSRGQRRKVLLTWHGPVGLCIDLTADCVIPL